MRRSRPTKDDARVRRFLARVDYADWVRLERLGPELVWILRHVYGVIRSSMETLASTGPWSSSHIQILKDQGLSVLKYRGALNPIAVRGAELRVAEFELRRRLSFLRANATLGAGDRELIDLALAYGARPAEITKRTNWLSAEVIAAFKRLAHPDGFEILEPGNSVRVAAFRELAESSVNPKARLERRILDELRQGKTLSGLAEEWNTSHTNLDSIVAEVRRELAQHPACKQRFAELQAESRRRFKGPPSVQICWLNSKLLPNYKLFRQREQPFSKRELKFIRLRASGKSIEHAAKQALGINRFHGSVIDRSFLGFIPAPRVDFPDELELPPFTDLQLQMMTEITYVRI